MVPHRSPPHNSSCLLVLYPAVGWLALTPGLLSIFKNASTLLSQVAAPIYHPPTTSPLSTPMPVFATLRLEDNSHSGRGKATTTLAFISTSLMAGDVEHFVHLFVNHLYSFCWKRLIKLLCPFLNQICRFLVEILILIICQISNLCFLFWDRLVENRWPTLLDEVTTICHCRMPPCLISLPQRDSTLLERKVQASMSSRTEGPVATASSSPLGRVENQD